MSYQPKYRGRYSSKQEVRYFMSNPNKRTLDGSEVIPDVLGRLADFKEHKQAWEEQKKKKNERSS